MSDPMSAIKAVWLQAERLGEHVHVRVVTGKQYGQPQYPDWRGPGMRNDAGDAGKLILRADQWPGFVRALAVGGHATGLRVMWRLTPDDNRYMWNGAPDVPCIVASTERVPWEKEATR